MSFNQIVLEEAARGRAILSAVKAQNGTITKNMRKAIQQLELLSAYEKKGGVITQKLAAQSVNISDYLATSTQKFINGRFWATANKASKELGILAPLIMAISGVFLSIFCFVAYRDINLSTEKAQLMAVSLAVLVLTFHSFLCAGTVVGTDKATTARKFLAGSFFLTPVIAVQMVYSISIEYKMFPSSVVYNLFIVGFFFLQGVPALILAFAFHKSPSGAAHEFEDLNDALPPMYTDNFNLFLIDPETFGHEQ